HGHRENQHASPRHARLLIAGLSDQSRDRMQPAVRDSPEVATPPKDAGAHGQLARQMADPPMAEFHKMTGCHQTAEYVIGADERILAVIAESVDQDVRNVLMPQPSDRWISQHAAGQDDPINPPGMQT